MGIDHGLGGKDNQKSKQKRDKRAVKNKSIAMRAMTGGKKKEVIFNENARVEWLTGFGKRKQERRKFGLAMEVLKKQKEHKEVVKDQRNAVKEAKMVELVKLGHDDDGLKEEVDYANENETESTIENDVDNVKVFGDESTISMFGSTVSVSIDTNVDSFASADFGDNNEIRLTGRNSHLLSSSNKKKPELTKMEKALKKAKVQMSSGRKKKHKDASFEGSKKSKTIKGKMESSKLLFKAMNKGGMGSSAMAYKGSKTKKGGGGQRRG